VIYAVQFTLLQRAKKKNKGQIRWHTSSLSSAAQKCFIQQD